MAIRYPIVPNTITVHLGKPDENVRNITVSFTDRSTGYRSVRIGRFYGLSSL